MTQSCFLDVKKRNDKSFVRQLWLWTRRSKIQFDMKQSYADAVIKGIFGIVGDFEYRLRTCSNKALEYGV